MYVGTPRDHEEDEGAATKADVSASLEKVSLGPLPHDHSLIENIGRLYKQELLNAGHVYIL